MNKLSKIDRSKALALEECERDIIMASRKGIEATRTIGARLRQIRDQELFSEVHKNFAEYLEERVGIPPEAGYRVIRLAETAAWLEDNNLPLPENDAQLSELTKLSPARQLAVWRLALDAREKGGARITVRTLQYAVLIDERNPDPAPAKTGIEEPDFELDQPGPSKPTNLSSNGEPEAPIRLSERGEEALERVERLCGKTISEAILERRIDISEDELIRWNQQTDDMVRKLAYYVVHQGWSVGEAIRFEDKDITVATPLGKLITLAQARGGQYAVELDSFEVRLSPIPLAAA